MIHIFIDETTDPIGNYSARFIVRKSLDVGSPSKYYILASKRYEKIKSEPM
jgi:hypothetical protein